MMKQQSKLYELQMIEFPGGQGESPDLYMEAGIIQILCIVVDNAYFSISSSKNKQLCTFLKKIK